MSSKQALVFGASGISGWAIARTCLSYPAAQSTFTRVIALANKPLDKSSFLLSEEDSRQLDTYGGIDLTSEDENVFKKLQEINGIENVTHVFYTAYAAHGSDFKTLKKTNVNILETAVKAIASLCPNLEFWTLQTGGKAYGVEFYGQPGVQWDLPLKESSPRIPEPYASNIFYYTQLDFLAAESKGKSWNYCEIRPDVIMGHSPRPNGIGFLHALGIFLSMYASVEGRGIEIPFPGNEMTWKAKRSDTSQDIVAKFHIYASLHPDQVAGKAINVADEDFTTWEVLWPEVCVYFGLKGVGPSAAKEGRLNGVEWVMAQKDNWATWVDSNGLKEGFVENSSWDVLGAIFAWVVFDKQYDLTVSREVGFKESAPTIEGYIKGFDRMKEAKIIPA